MTAKEDKEKEKTRRENLSKFIYQLANTCFTAMVVVAAVGLVLGVEDAKPYALQLKYFNHPMLHAQSCFATF